MGNEDLNGKLKTFATMMKFGHDLFDAEDLSSAASMAVNNSRILLNFRNSLLFEITADKKCVLLARFAQITPDPHVAQVQFFQKKAEKIAVSGEDVHIIASDGTSGKEEKGNCFCIRFTSPPAAGGRYTFLWILEYEKEIPSYVENTVKLLTRSVAEALTLVKCTAHPAWKDPLKRKKKFFWMAVVLLAVFALFIPVRERASASFTVKAPEVTAAYAWFDGPIEKCLKQDGEKVRKGEVIALYETSRRKYQYAIALAALREAETELELERQNAFSDESKLGKVKLLQERCKMLKVPVEEAQWYLQHTEIHAPASGILALTDKRAELLAGKAVKTGEKLFEVLSNDGLIALIHVNEQESSLLQGDFSVKLFLHTAPEKAVEGTVEECSAYPVLTEQNLYCYPVRVRLKKDDTLHLKVGMRGVAKLSGRKRFLGYLFFKNIILYFRNL